jgi:hypothetical protein
MNRMKQLELFGVLDANNPDVDAGVPLVRVKTCRPQIHERGGGWLCLLECGHEAHVPVGPRPRHVPHRCPGESDDRSVPDR